MDLPIGGTAQGGWRRVVAVAVLSTLVAVGLAACGDASANVVSASEDPETNLGADHPGCAPAVLTTMFSLNADAEGHPNVGAAVESSLEFVLATPPLPAPPDDGLMAEQSPDQPGYRLVEQGGEGAAPIGAHVTYRGASGVEAYLHVTRTGGGGWIVDYIEHCEGSLATV